jgi:hypothetical protein
MVTLDPTNIQNYVEMGEKIAKGLTKFNIEEKHNCPEKFIFCNVPHADNPKQLNYHLMDKDCVAILNRMYGSENGSTKEESMEYGDLLAMFFGSEEKGKEVLQAVDNYTWDMLGVKRYYMDTGKEREH